MMPAARGPRNPGTPDALQHVGRQRLQTSEPERSPPPGHFQCAQDNGVIERIDPRSPTVVVAPNDVTSSPEFRKGHSVEQHQTYQSTKNVGDIIPGSSDGQAKCQSVLRSTRSIEGTPGKSLSTWPRIGLASELRRRRYLRSPVPTTQTCILTSITGVETSVTRSHRLSGS